MTKATGFAGLPELVEQRAGHRALQRVFRAQNIPLEILDSRETRLPIGAMMAIFEDAARAVGERTLGMDIGMSMSHREFGLWMHYSVTAPTLSEALVKGYQNRMPPTVRHHHRAGV